MLVGWYKIWMLGRIWGLGYGVMKGVYGGHGVGKGRV